MSRPTHWETETLYTTGDAYFADLLSAVSNAKHSIELESYIYEPGVLAERVFKALIAASQRGVRVRMLVDGWGAPGFANQFWPALKSNGVRVRFYRVNPWILRRLPGDPKGLSLRFWARWRKVNRGNHRKFCLVDKTELWAGSFNISDVHLREVAGDEAWKDIGVRVTGDEVRFAKRAFERAFRGWTALNLPARSPRLLLLNDSFLHQRRTRLEQILRIRHAHGRIWLATPYFVPVGKVFRLLARQAKRGRDVRLMVPHKSDVWFVKWMSWPLLMALKRKGVKIFLYTPQFSHQKIFIADDWICVGSTNLNHRSFLHDLEMDVVITHDSNKRQIFEGYEKDQEFSRTFDSSEWIRLPWWKRWLGSFFLIARYWA